MPQKTTIKSCFKNNPLYEDLLKDIKVLHNIFKSLSANIEENTYLNPVILPMMSLADILKQFNDETKFGTVTNSTNKINLTETIANLATKILNLVTTLSERDNFPKKEQTLSVLQQAASVFIDYVDKIQKLQFPERHKKQSKDYSARTNIVDIALKEGTAAAAIAHGFHKKSAAQQIQKRPAPVPISSVDSSAKL